MKEHGQLITSGGTGLLCDIQVLYSYMVIKAGSIYRQAPPPVCCWSLRECRVRYVMKPQRTFTKKRNLHWWWNMVERL